jgi:hypothetical protein
MPLAMAWDVIRVSAVTVPETVAFRDMAQETILLNLRTGKYHAIDRIGARFFAEMRSAPSLASAVAVLAGEFDVPQDELAQDLHAFATQLLDFGLIELRAARDPGA